MPMIVKYEDQVAKLATLFLQPKVKVPKLGTFTLGNAKNSSGKVSGWHITKLKSAKLALFNREGMGSSSSTGICREQNCPIQ